jgi:thiamine-phosphate pyrophosphorylase
MFGPPLGLPILEETARAVRVPIFAIGGVTPTRSRELRRAGAFGVAVIAAVLGADDVEAATTMLIDALTALP